jgi:hypothetical protein
MMAAAARKQQPRPQQEAGRWKPRGREGRKGKYGKRELRIRRRTSPLGGRRQNPPPPKETAVCVKWGHPLPLTYRWGLVTEVNTPSVKLPKRKANTKGAGLQAAGLHKAGPGPIG